MRLDGKVAMVTGTSPNIGAGIAGGLAEEGAKVVCVDVSADNAQECAAWITGRGGQAIGLTCDVSDEGQVEAAVARAREAYGGIDVLVNNAGGQFPAPALGTSPKGFDAVVRNNLNGTFYVTREVAERAMIPRRSGAIVNVIANQSRGFPGMAHTGAARAGVENLTMSLAVEWAEHDVRVNAVAPGVIRSSGIDRYPPELIEQGIARTPQKRLGTVEETAHAIVYLASPAALFVTGATLRIDGGAALWGDIWQIPPRSDR